MTDMFSQCVDAVIAQCVPQAIPQIGFEAAHAASKEATLYDLARVATEVMQLGAVSSTDKPAFTFHHGQFAALPRSSESPFAGVLQQVIQKLEFHTSHMTVGVTEDKWRVVGRVVESVVENMSSSFEDVVFPYNRYTRKRADLNGSTLHIPGLIRAVSSDFTYKKFMASKKSGGKREYVVGFALDTSMSMRGHLEFCAVTTLTSMILSLVRMDMSNFFIITFGSKIRLVKAPTQAWDVGCIANYLANLCFDTDNSTNDAAAIDAAVDIFNMESRGSKKLFVLTDGYSSCGSRLGVALCNAEAAGVEVVGISVGMEATGIFPAYQTYIHAMHPTHVPAALRSLYQRDAPPVDRDDLYRRLRGFMVLAQDASERTSDVDRKDVFTARIRDILDGERKAHLIPGSGGELRVDVCFVLDVTGSMSPYIADVKSQLRAIAENIVVKVQKICEGITVSIRFGLVGYRDIGDTPTHECFEFTEDIPTFVKTILALECKGGGDIPEDVVLGLTKAVDLFTQIEVKEGKSGGARFGVLITDAPAHGAECCSDPTDRYPGGSPSGSISDAMESFRSHDIELVLCHVKKSATQMMERVMESHYNKKRENLPDRTLQTVRLFDEIKVEGKLYHFIFLMDGSGSMRAGIPSGGNRWDGLVRSYKRFISARSKNQGGGDIISVVFHDDDAKIIFQHKAITALQELPSPDWRGNNFARILDKTRPVISSTPHGYVPVLIFMTDGGDCADRPSGLRMMDTIAAENVTRGFVCHTVLAYDLAEKPLMQSYVRGGGECIMADDEMKLTQAFVKIANTCNAMDSLVQMFSGKVGEMVADRIALDYL